MSSGTPSTASRLKPQPPPSQPATPFLVAPPSTSMPSSNAPLTAPVGGGGGSGGNAVSDPNRHRDDRDRHRDRDRDGVDRERDRDSRDRDRDRDRERDRESRDRDRDRSRDAAVTAPYESRSSHRSSTGSSRKDEGSSSKYKRSEPTAAAGSGGGGPNPVAATGDDYKDGRASYTRHSDRRSTTTSGGGGGGDDRYAGSSRSRHHRSSRHGAGAGTDTDGADDHSIDLRGDAEHIPLPPRGGGDDYLDDIGPEDIEDPYDADEPDDLETEHVGKAARKRRTWGLVSRDRPLARDRLDRLLDELADEAYMMSFSKEDIRSMFHALAERLRDGFVALEQKSLAATTGNTAATSVATDGPPRSHDNHNPALWSHQSGNAGVGGPKNPNSTLNNPSTSASSPTTTRAGASAAGQNLNAVGGGGGGGGGSL